MSRSQAVTHHGTVGSRVSTSLDWLIPAVILASVWFLSHPYTGVAHDARIYVTSALLNSIPADVSNDNMFKLDGQLGFTVFPSIIRFFSSIMGPSTAALVISLAALSAWITAFWFFVSRITQDRSRYVMMIFVALFAVPYGGYHIFTISEPYAVPRPFAEVFVLIALIFAIQSRFVVSAGFVVVAGLLHPITALPAAALVWLMAVTDKEQTTRWRASLLVTSGIGLLCAIGLAILDAPIFGRLFHTIDPEWMEPLKGRTRYLFVFEWRHLDLALLVVQSCVLIIAGSLVTNPNIRRLFLCVLAVVAAALAATAILGDWFHSVLVVQVQIWRATWILTVLSALSLAICCISLWKQDRSMKLVLAMVIIAWFGLPINAVAGASIALLSLAAFLVFKRTKFEVSTVSLALVWMLAGATLLTMFAITAPLARIYALADTASLFAYPKAIIVTKLFAIPVGIISLVWQNMPKRSYPRAVGVAVALMLAVLAVSSWDTRNPWQKKMDRFEPDQSLTAMIEDKPGSVLWIDDRGTDAWVLAGRTSWWTMLQGASQVFSRPLAMIWKDRRDAMIEAGIVDERIRDPYVNKSAVEDYQVSKSTLAQICSVPDGPSWVIAGLWQFDEQDVKRLDPKSIWTSEHRQQRFLSKGGVSNTPIHETEFYVHECI
ncbi:hypothetical protein [Hoeflea prorocentri]|uniref:Uncharacterized protein n=1 Tax=Hoeflea prorocentri TaxID=1922333 RepID=A0A9X3ZJI7_9HYPH|nr:hypothetical protein [Hoeflea prorocentri]MCY6383143.1 hypothetical protein [Hoeflea prorocentri]MDA5400943.1 hypothetical protein [Hoeflea prorocentri]